MSATDPLTDYMNNGEDMSEVACCRHCRLLIEPGTEREWNGWDYHTHCVPLHVLYGREQEQRDDEAVGK